MENFSLYNIRRNNSFVGSYGLVLQYSSGRDLGAGAGNASVIIFMSNTLSRMNITEAAIRSPNRGDNGVQLSACAWILL